MTTSTSASAGVGENASASQNSAPVAVKQDSDPPRSALPTSLLSRKLVELTQVLQEPQLPRLDGLLDAESLGELKRNAHRALLGDQMHGSEQAASGKDLDLPFAPRENLFEPVLEDTTSAGAATELRQTASAAEDVDLGDQVVVLHGFATVGRTKAVLSIAGATHSLAVGEHKSGIEVERIAPPKVHLRRGANAWTLSLFEPVRQQQSDEN